jgi:predicted nucleic acid-binding protein
VASDGHIDTDVIIRFLTGDDPVKQAAAARLFARVEAREISLTVIDTVIADAVFVLTSPRIYGLSREDTSAALSTLVAAPGLVMRNKTAMLGALHLFASTRLDFGDCLIVANMQGVDQSILYSYDRDFDRFDDIERVEP